MKPLNSSFPIEGQKIVLASEIRGYEKLLIDQSVGFGETLMDRAAFNMYQYLKQEVFPLKGFKEIIILSGKGNNGADGYAIGSLLLKDGYKTKVYQVYNQDSDLCKKKASIYKSNKGEIVYIENAKTIPFAKDTLVIDALLGTGFKGQVLPLMEQVIDACNSSKSFVFSIDIASGVDGDSGTVKGKAIFADITACLGVLKIGNIFQQGIDHAGSLKFIDLGIDLSPLSTENYLVNPLILYHSLPKRSKTMHKYRAGQVLVVAGSKQMDGAGHLACTAAYRSGCGMVRHFSRGKKGGLEEVVFSPYSKNGIKQELQRTKSILVGPGLGRDKGAKKIVEEILAIENIPIVIDADALYLMKNPKEGAVLTPHKGELMDLLNIKESLTDIEIINRAKNYADKHRVYIIYKGVPTVIFSPGEKNIVVVTGDSGMAKGGSGDVLSGIAASLLAQGIEKKLASVLAVMLHGMAGQDAAKRLSSHYMIASDIIESLSKIFLEIELFT